MCISRPNAFLLDMDGVLYHNNNVLPHAIDFLNCISELPVIFVTNNPTKVPKDIILKLSKLGFPSYKEAQILTSACATAKWLQQQTAGFRFYAVGSPALKTALDKYGTEDPIHANYVVIGEGPGLSYESLSIGINLILSQGAKLISTNPDINVDGSKNNEHTILPGGGALVAPFSVATGITPIYIGKPNALLFEMALARLNLPPANCMMIGDRPDTDILGAQQLGIQTALVRTGRFMPREELPHNISPNIDCNNLSELAHKLFGVTL